MRVGARSAALNKERVVFGGAMPLILLFGRGRLAALWQSAFFILRVGRPSSVLKLVP